MEKAITFNTIGGMKYLGVHIDSCLDFSKHVGEICSAAFLQLRTIRRTRPCLNRAATIQLCNTLVLSRIDYCLTILNGIKAKDLERLQRVLNAAARIVFRCSRTTHTSPLLKKLNWLNMQQRRTFHTACWLHKILHSGAPSYISCEVHRYQHERTLRSNSENLLVPAVGRTGVGNHILKVLAADVWNRLPIDLRGERRFGAFRNGLLKHLTGS
jgi:hypothetical protein